jgi:trigger factor
MQCTIKKLPKGLVELTISVGQEEIASALEKAAQEISKDHPLDGYRPGKAGYEAVAKRYGEQVIQEAALPGVVRRNYVQAVKDNSLNTYGEPEISVTKLAPGNPIEFTATVALVPEITNLADPAAIKVDTKTPRVEDKEVDGTIHELQKMQTREIRVAREVRDKDKIVVDMDLSRDGVAVEGGQARGHGIYLDEEYYIPGLKEKVLGMKEGETREFSLKFPKDHFQKMLAGADVGFKVTVKEIFELQFPAIDEEFAKALGQESVNKLRELLTDNILKDKTHKEEQRVEAEILEQMVKKSRFGEIPERMVNSEVDRMLHELKHGLEEKNVKFEDYLQNIKKTLEALKLDFAKQAIERVKTALVVREYGIREKIEIPDADVMKEVEQMINRYSEDAEAQQTIRSEDYQDYIRTTLRNHKVVALLRERANVVKK